jgi:6-phosphogluconolactonase (cycloisomerase 2 family)
MRMKCRLRVVFLPLALMVILMVILTACVNTTYTPLTGTGYFWVAAAGNTTISAYTIDLTTGELSQNGNSIGTGILPTAIKVVPSGTALFTANSNSSCQNASGATVGCIGRYSILSNGLLNQVTPVEPAGLTPVALAMDPTGAFLYVANQGDNTISVFTVKGTTLTLVETDDTNDPLYPGPSNPTSIAITPTGNYLYVASQYSDVVSGFTYNSTTGSLTRMAPFSVPSGANPSSLALTLDGSYLYVANSGSNTISAFATCAVTSSTCATPTGQLSEISGSPFASGLGPVHLVVAHSGYFLYAADKQSNQISGYKIGSGPAGLGTGSLTPTTPPTFSTGTNPVWLATPSVGGYLYCANSGSATVSAFVVDAASGNLGSVSGTPYPTFDQPMAIGLK